MNSKLSSVKVASARAHLTGSRWLDQAYGSGRALATSLGSGEVDDFLPGLGELTAWGVLGGEEHPEVSGAIVTGFWSAPETVSVMLTALVDGNNLLDLAPLATLANLPKHCLDEFAFQSWHRGPGISVRDRGKVVLHSRSREAVELCKKLLVHLVRDVSIAEDEQEMASRAPLFVRTNQGRIVTDYRMAVPTDALAEWIEIKDWA